MLARVAVEPSRENGRRIAAVPTGDHAGAGALGRRTNGAARPLRPSQVPAQAPRDVLRGSGQPLATPLREELGTRLGADLSTVRLHTGSSARASAAALGARAYTAGEHVVIGGGADKQTLAHELAHVIQQRRGPVAGTDHGDGLKVSDPADRFERQAEAMARQAAPGTGPAETAVPRSARPAPVVQRLLDYLNFTPDALKTAEGKQCHAFALIVSKFVDEAHADLLAGKIKSWKGPKLATFLQMLNRGEPMALVHVGNVIEERVYALMDKTKMPLEWTKQSHPDMGAVSKPDIILHLDSGNDGLIDITSDRFHVLAKGGKWVGGKHVYVAEAYFNSVTAGELPIIKANAAKGGVGQSQVTKMVKAAAAARAAKEEAWGKEVAEARDLVNEYDSGTAFAEAEFDGNMTAMEKWCLSYGIRKKGFTKRGATKLKRGRKSSDETKAKRRSDAAKKRKVAREDEAAVAVGVLDDIGDVEDEEEYEDLSED